MTKQLLQFISNHWLLCTASVAILAFIIFEEMKGRITGILKISALDATLLLNRENAVVIDTRSQAMFANGHILGAINLTPNDIESNLKKLEPHKNQTLILVDEYGTNTSATETKLQQHGFTKIRILAGGLTSWREAQLPLARKN